MDFSGIGGIIPPKSELEYREPPEMTVINQLNNGGSEHRVTESTTDANIGIQPPNPQQAPIKITPPPPRFVQAKLPTAAPMAFTVLGAGMST